MTLTREQAAAEIRYDPELGTFTRLICRPKAPIGSNAAASLDSHGYPRVCIRGRKYLAHRLAWLFVHGTWPNGDLDHANRDRTDNRIANLRPATRRENLGNIARSSRNTSGIKGVHRYKATGRWQAYINIHGKRKHLGFFATPEEAGEVYKTAAREVFGEFAHGG